jgi:hypothetical protein
MIQQKRENARRLLLNPTQRAVLTELECLLVEFEFTKSNQRHGRERWATEALRHYSKSCFNKLGISAALASTGTALRMGATIAILRSSVQSPPNITRWPMPQ